LFGESVLKEELVLEFIDFLETDYFLGSLYELYEYTYIESLREQLIDHFVKEPEIFSAVPSQSTKTSHDSTSTASQPVIPVPKLITFIYRLQT